jgi:hypothetical protein
VSPEVTLPMSSPLVVSAFSYQFSAKTQKADG